MPPLRTNIYEIGTKIKERLVALEVVGDASQIVWSARQKMPHIKGKLDIVLRPRRQQHLASWEKGGQRYNLVMTRVIDIFMRTSYAGTELADDEAWYAQHVPLEDAVFNALVGQMLTNARGDDYLTAPIKYAQSIEEIRETDVKAAQLWGDSSHSFEVHFIPKVDVLQKT